MGKFKKKVAEFVCTKFLAPEINEIKNQMHEEAIQQVQKEIQHYQNVIAQLQEDKINLSSKRFQEEIQNSLQSKERQIDLEKDNQAALENPFKDYL